MQHTSLHTSRYCRLQLLLLLLLLLLHLGNVY
jgi:hypothetical protein